MRTLSPEEVDALLYDLCVTHGFCLPPAAQIALQHNPPPDVASFVAAVDRADGEDLTVGNRRVYRGVHAAVMDAFRKAGLDVADT
jgi:hypothetical protein